LVKNEPESITSKGYCFVEYVDPNVTPVAVIGLNGMDLGGGKVLSVRIAGERSEGNMTVPTIASTLGAAPLPPLPSAPRPDAVIIDGYDIEVLVDAAMGLRPMPTAPMHVDQYGMPITRAIPALLAVAAVPPPQAVPSLVSSLPHGTSAYDIASAALDAAMGKLPPATTAAPTSRILVLLNMVSEEDLATEDEYEGLQDEVHDECAKFGKLVGMKIPRYPSASVQPSAVKKIFLEYATVQDAANAERELAGRQFGPNVVKVCRTIS
jgi:hypothetical protein